MKKILCYGDSNTYGFNPKDGSRFDDKTRWTKILTEKLEDRYVILEEGANNRTGFFDNIAGFDYSASRHFPKILSKNKDIEILILAIGTNDLQFCYNATLKNIENGLENLIIAAKKYCSKIIIVPPVILDNNILNGYFKIQFDETSITKSKKVGKIYRKLAGVYGCKIFDINNFQKPSNEDGLHYNKEAHKLIGEKLAEFIRKEC